MHKKLLAVAVAGALAAPAIAVAQSTVQIYGRLTYEYGWVDRGRDRHNTDYADTPGGSAIGFKGVETLGGGMSAWFQCETSADVRGLDKVGLCSRNSAVGFRGGFGNLFFGRWDTPMKRAMNVGTVGAEETGTLGMSFLPFGGSGGSAGVLGNAISDFGDLNDALAALEPLVTSLGGDPSLIPTFGDVAARVDDLYGEHMQRQRFMRRETCLTTYETPNFGGFQVMGAVSCGNTPVDNGYLKSMDLNNVKPRVISAAATYVNGPLGIGAAWEKHQDFGGLFDDRDRDDRGWGVSAAYTFGKSLKVGATFLDRKWETATGNTKKRTWTIGAELDLGGPHSVSAQYASAGNTRGNGSNIGGNGGAVFAADGGRSATGGDAWSIAYQYDFSKRTTVKLGYVHVDNDRNSNSFRLGSGGPSIERGDNQDGIAFLIKHNF